MMGLSTRGMEVLNGRERERHGGGGYLQLINDSLITMLKKIIKHLLLD